MPPGVAQGHGTVEHQGIGGRVLVQAEVAFALELKAALRIRVAQAGFDHAAVQHTQGLRVDVVQEALAFGHFRRVGGLEQALACDIIVAADHAEFGLPEPKRGLIAGSAGVHRLPRQIGLKPAMGYMLTGRHIPADRAYQLGLVNEVVAFDKLDEAVDAFVADILRCAPLAVRATKEAAMRGLDYPLAQAYYTRYESNRQREKSLDALEGPRAFAEKRSPDWKGR